MLKFKEIDWFMDIAIEESYKAYSDDEVPVGAVIIAEDGSLLARAHNQKEKVFDPCGHAEILAIREASKLQKNWRLTGCSIVVTLEPCPMCLHAIVQARLEKLYFGAYDTKGGSLSLNYNFHKDKRLNHNFEVMGGVSHYKNSQFLSKFFREKRKSFKQKSKFTN